MAAGGLFRRRFQKPDRLPVTLAFAMSAKYTRQVRPHVEELSRLCDGSKPERAEGDFCGGNVFPNSLCGDHMLGLPLVLLAHCCVEVIFTYRVSAIWQFPHHLYDYPLDSGMCSGFRDYMLSIWLWISLQLMLTPNGKRVTGYEIVKKTKPSACSRFCPAHYSRCHFCPGAHRRHQPHGRSAEGCSASPQCPAHLRHG